MWLRILTLTLGAAAIGTEGFVLPGILPRIAHEFSVSVASSGQLVTLFGAVYALGSPLGTALLANMNRRTLLITTVTLFGAGAMLEAMAPNVMAVAIARTLLAVLAGLYIPTAAAVAATLVAPSQRGRALALISGASSLATVFGVPTGIWLASRFGWRTTFGFIATLCIASAIGITAALPPVPRLPPISLRERVRLLGQGVVLTSLAVTTLWMMAGFIIYTYISPIMRELSHTSDATLSGLILTWGVAGAVGSWLGGYGADRFGATRVIIPLLVILAVNFLCLPWTASTIVGAAVFMSVWGAAGWGFSPPQQHHLVRLAPAAAAVALSLNTSAIYLGISLGAGLGGVLLASSGIQWLGVAACLCDLVAVVLLLLTYPRAPAALETSGRPGQAE